PMRDHEDGTTRRPSNAFTPEFLARLDQQDEPLTAAQADVAGPWIVVPIPSPGWAVLRRGESLAAGDVPRAVFVHRERALLAAAVLPGTGFDRLFRLQHERSPEGYAVESNGQVVGHLRHFDPELATAMHIAESLVRLPECLTRLLAASGAVALETAGRLLMEGERTA
ncbi:MAG TPA: hypothetical protein VFE33_01885, partial [Thermoanaerobaculia bacterium]|nr:hypothetical protein [Thermoanaerobaculia bacterium]